MKLGAIKETDVVAKYEELLQRQAELENELSETENLLNAVSQAKQEYAEQAQRRIAEAQEKVETVEQNVEELTETMNLTVSKLTAEADEAIMARKQVDTAFGDFCSVAGDYVGALDIAAKATLLQSSISEIIRRYCNDVEVNDWEQLVDFAVRQGYGKRSQEWQALSKAFSPSWRELPKGLQEKIKEWQSAGNGKMATAFKEAK